MAAGHPLRPPAPGAAVSDLALSAGDRSLTATYRHRGLRQGDVLTWIVYTRPDPGSPWRQRPALSGFQRFDGPDGDTGRVDLRTGQCPASGDYRVDLYLGRPPGVGRGHPAAAAGAAGRRRRPPGQLPCVPPGDVDGGNPGSRPAGRAVARRRPAHDGQGVPGLTGADQSRRRFALATLADRLAARRRFQLRRHPPRGQRRRRPAGDSARLPAGRRARPRPAHLGLPGPDDVLRTVVLEGAPGDRPLFDRLLSRVGFADLEG